MRMRLLRLPWHRNRVYNIKLQNSNSRRRRKCDMKTQWAPLMLKSCHMTMCCTPKVLSSFQDVKNCQLEKTMWCHRREHRNGKGHGGVGTQQVLRFRCAYLWMGCSTSRHLPLSLRITALQRYVSLCL